MTNDVAIIGASPIDGSYGIFTEYVLFNQSNPVVLQFKELDFFTFDEFLRTFYEMLERPDILDISYESASRDLASLEADLKDYGLVPSKVDSTRTLVLRSNTAFRDRSNHNAFLLKFSGKISLENNLAIEDASVVFDAPLFTNSHLFKIQIKGTTDPYNTIVYMRDTDVHYLVLDDVMGLWVSGLTNLGKLWFASSDESSFDSICDVNIAPSSVITIKESFEVVNVNCINIGGILKSDKDISIKFANRYGEFDLKPSAALKAPLGKISLSGASNISMINNGFIGAKTIKLRYGAGALHNNGTILTKESGTISGTKLFNHKAGQIFAKQLNVKTIDALYNIGNITIDDFTLAAPSTQLGGGIIYNDGNITTRRFDIQGKTHFLNNKNGTIRAEAELNCQLFKDWHNIDYSKGIVSLGHIIMQSGAVDLEFIYAEYGQFTVEEMLTGTLQAIACIGSKCKFGINLNNQPQIAADSSAEMEIRSNTLQKVKLISVGTHTDMLLPGLEPASSTGIVLANLPVLNTTQQVIGFTKLVGSFIIEAAFLNQRGKLILGDAILAISDIEGSEGIGNDITINSIFISEGAILMTDKNGMVFINNMNNHDGKIISLGGLTINNWNLQGTITFSGNINGPAITEPVNLILNNTRLAINGTMFNSGLTTVIEDSMIICDAFIQSGIISGEAGLKIKASEFVMRAVLDMVTKFVGHHEFTESLVTSQPRVDLEGAFELDIDKLVSIEGGVIIADKIKIKSGDKVIIMPTPLYKRIHAHWGRGHRTEENISLLVPELTGENGIEILSDGGIMLYSGKYKSNLPIILNAGEMVSIEGVAEGNKVDYYNSWTKRRWYGAKKTCSESIIESHFYPNFPVFSASLQINAGQGLSIVGVRIEGKGQTEFLIGKEGMSSLAKMAPMMEIHLYDRHFTSKRTFLGFIPLGRKRDAHYKSSQIPRLNLIESTEGIKAYIHGSFIQVGTVMKGNQITIEATESISLSSAFEIKYTQQVHESISFGDLKCKFNLKEFSLGIGGTYKRTSDSSLEITPIESVYNGNLHLIAPQVNTMGIKGQGGIFMVTAKTWNDSPAEARFSSDFSIIEGSATLKLGIKIGSGNFMNSIRGAFNGARNGSPEGLVNAGFASYAAYLASVEILAGGPPKAGAWVELSASMVKQGRNGIRVVPSRFNYDAVVADLDEGNLMATQIDAYNAYIKAKNELKLSSSKNTDSIKKSFASVEIDIPLTGGVPGINLSGGKSEQYVDQHLHFVLRVQNELKISVLGKASIVGATISARSLDASFGQLLLESVKDLIKRESFGHNIGLTSNSLSGIGAEYSNGLREMVSKITSIIGTENIKIVVANALHLNGAMIANAQTDENGKLTDLGNLEVLAGLLFVQHVYTHDDGVTFGASMVTGRTKAKESNNAYRVSFGVDSGDGIVRATIGKGKSSAHDNLNRDINNAIEFNYDINLKTIHLYFQNRDNVAEERAAERVNNVWQDMMGMPDDMERRAQEESSKEDGTPNIKFFARAVEKSGGVYQHGYTVFTFSDGKQIIAAGFPEESNMLKDNLKGVMVEYTKENLDKGLFLEKDWKGSKRELVQEWKFESDSELSSYVSKAKEAINFVETGNEGGRFDYDICLTDICPGSNSNTVQRKLYEKMGLVITLNEELNLAGIKGRFFEGILDRANTRNRIEA